MPSLDKIKDLARVLSVDTSYFLEEDYLKSTNKKKWWLLGINALYYGITLVAIYTFSPKINHVSLGLSILSVALLILMLFISNGNMLVMVIIYLIISIGRTMSFGNTLTLSLSKIPNESRADGNAIFSAGQQLAGSVGSALTATVISNNTDFLTGNKIVIFIFIIATIVCLRLIFRMNNLLKYKRSL